MRILLTGAMGYLGRPLGKALEAASFDVTRLDAGFFDSCALQEQPEECDAPLSRTDTRDVQLQDLIGHDAIVHLAELSNDPLGQMQESLTLAINQRATSRLAELAMYAGMQRFVYISSCSVYGATNGQLMTESHVPRPLTAYAKSKVAAEGHILGLASAHFSPVVLRLATAFGSSTALRLDLAVNDFVHSALTTREVRLASDGRAWRPFVHVHDICDVVLAVLNAPRTALSGHVINVGSEKQTMQIHDMATLVAHSCGARVKVVSNDSDNRSYRVDFSKLRNLLGQTMCSRMIGPGIAELQDFLTIYMQQISHRGPDAFRRLDSLKFLIESGRLDQQLRWAKLAGS